MVFIEYWNCDCRYLGPGHVNGFQYKTYEFRNQLRGTCLSISNTRKPQIWHRHKHTLQRQLVHLGLVFLSFDRHLVLRMKIYVWLYLTLRFIYNFRNVGAAIGKFPPKEAGNK